MSIINFLFYFYKLNHFSIKNRILFVIIIKNSAINLVLNGQIIERPSLTISIKLVKHKSKNTII